MKYPAHIYATALAKAIAAAPSEKAEQIAKNFISLVQRNGDASSLRKILEETSRYVRRDSGIRKVTIESARELSAQNKKEIAKFVKPGDIVVENINPELVAGVRVIIDDELQLDETLKGKLDKIFSDIQN
ncbi:MAG: F0F1 ATP synthase subunit delta [Patescibacteria group bacterium]|nr:F0F1 ATP synthase subunit delta [Patescibacteria group bacterium]MCL5224077.1 F0F1 ATP synthase subunit delta [Patescibacteria group bacterium]